MTVFSNGASFPSYGATQPDHGTLPEISSAPFEADTTNRSRSTFPRNFLIIAGAFVITFCAASVWRNGNSVPTTSAPIMSVDSTTERFDTEFIKHPRFRMGRKEGCTAIVATPGATVSGELFQSQTIDDNPPGDVRLGFTPAKDHPKGAKRPIFRFNALYPRYAGKDMGKMYFPLKREKVSKPIGEIPEVRHTYAYYAADYALLNEHQVAMVESTAASKLAVDYMPEGPSLLGLEELTRLGLERGKTAREAIQIMGDLAQKYGFADAGEMLIVSDPTEAFVFHILAASLNGSAVWVAQRVPDGHMTIVANCYTIRYVNLSDTFNFMGSKNMFEVAEHFGWWKKGEPFHFTRVFSAGEYEHKYYSGRRMWRILDWVAPDLHLNPNYSTIFDDPYPWSVKPRHKLSIKDFFAFNRDHYEGTPYDMTVGLAAGPFGNPRRYAYGANEEALPGGWERTISSWKTLYSVIEQLQPQVSSPAGGVLWYGPHNPHATFYSPMRVVSGEVPSPMTICDPLKLDRRSAWWGARVVCNIADLWYLRAITDIRKFQAHWEGLAIELVNRTNSFHQPGTHHHPNPNHVSVAKLKEMFEQQATGALNAWWALADRLMVRYADGYIVNDDGEFESPGYPVWWLLDVGYTSGPLRASRDSIIQLPYQYSVPSYNVSDAPF